MIQTTFQGFEPASAQADSPIPPLLAAMVPRNFLRVVFIVPSMPIEAIKPCQLRVPAGSGGSRTSRTLRSR